MLTKIALAGYTGSGKTCFLMGLYYLLKTQRHDFALREDSPYKKSAEKIMTNIGYDTKFAATSPENRGFPEGTNENRVICLPIQYRQQYDIDLLLMDCIGGDPSRDLKETISLLPPPPPPLSARKEVDILRFKTEGENLNYKIGEYFYDLDFLFFLYDVKSAFNVEEQGNLLNRLRGNLDEATTPIMALLLTKADEKFTPTGGDNNNRLPLYRSMGWPGARRETYHSAAQRLVNRLGVRVPEGLSTVFPISAVGENYPHTIEPFGYRELFDWIVPQCKR